MKIKIIDLLNLVYEKKTPKKIKWNYHVYIYDEQYDDYFEETTALFENEMSNGMLFKSLGDYVEIIEERPKNIEEWGKIPLKELEEKELERQELQMYLKTVIDTQNELIRGHNYLLKKENSK